MKVGPKSGIRLAAIIAMALCWVTAPADASIISVTNTNDSGPGSLRQALAIANVGDYSGIASTNGVVVPLWTDIRSGSNQDAYIVHAGGATATTTPTATATATCPPGGGVEHSSGNIPSPPPTCTACQRSRLTTHGLCGT